MADLVTDLDIPYGTLTTIIFLALLFAIFRFPDLVAVIIIVASMAGLGLRWLSNRYYQLNPQQDNWRKERRKWEEGDRWW